MQGLDLTLDIAQRLRGHWRRSLAEPLRGRSAILILHRVLPDEQEARLPHRAPYCLGPESFRHLLMSLVEVARIVSLDTALKPHRDPRACIALTFDDGWRDTAETAAPVLDHYALPASVFVTTGLLGKPRGFWWEVLAEGLWSRQRLGLIRDTLGDAGLPLPPMPPKHPDDAYSRALLRYLTMLQQAPASRLDDATDCLHQALGQAPHGLDPFSLRRLEASGLFRFGAHGVRPHPLDMLDDQAASFQIRRSRHDLAKLCREPLDAFAFSDPQPSSRLKQLASQCGVQVGLAGSGGWLSHHDDPLALPRMPISQPVAQSPGRLYDWLLGHP
ncbi:polysaccharide deacetylase family protein [Aidingimonas lacisalsi]|uniref:polysaccharide deacetylase family protein n=1 Tax=Aidingimonas lacisalsi TaxID=2604086 RepID=UPI0011D24FF4|nr:polysaccharide deacetylase family protein [Aidingimonas lacisalsi]